MKLLDMSVRRVRKILNDHYDKTFEKVLEPSIGFLLNGEFDNACENDKAVIDYVSKIEFEGSKINKIKSKRAAILLSAYISALDSIALAQKDSMEYNVSVKLFCESLKNGTINSNCFDMKTWCKVVTQVLKTATRICAMDTYRDIYDRHVKDLPDKYKAKIVSQLLGYNCGDVSFDIEVKPMFDRFSDNVDKFDDSIKKSSNKAKIRAAKTEYIFYMLKTADMCFVELPDMERIIKGELEAYTEIAAKSKNRTMHWAIHKLIMRLLRKDRCIDEIKRYTALFDNAKDAKTLEYCEKIKITLKEIETGELQSKPAVNKYKKDKYKELVSCIESGDQPISVMYEKCIEAEEYYSNIILKEKEPLEKLNALKALYQIKYMSAKQSYWDKFNKALKMVEAPVTEDTVYFVPCDNFLIVGAYSFPLLMAAKKKGSLCVPSSPHTFEFETDDEELKEIAGSFYNTHFKDVFETNRNRAEYKIDIPNKIIEVDGLNIYEPIYEVVSRWQFSLFFNFETNAWARGQVYRFILYFQNVFEQCRALHAWAKKNNKAVRVIHSTPHVQAGAAWRIYCEEEGYKDNIEFIHVRNGYDDYFNSGTGKSATLSALNMTKNLDCRMSLYGTKEGFEKYYRKNSDNIDEITKKAQEWFTFQRSVVYDKSNAEDERKRSQILETIKKYKAEGKKVYLLIGKLIFDLGVKWTKGTAHDDMSHWATHVVETINNNPDVLLLIKPHPHETRKDITMTEESVKTFRDIILTELNDNVIYLDGHLFRNFDLAQYVDVGITWNSTSSLELTSLGIKTVMGDEWGYLDYPIDFIKLTSEEEYADFLNDPDKYEMPEDLPQKAMVFLDYMGSSDINIPNRYTQTTSTNFNVFESDIYFDAIEEYIENGDYLLDEYFNSLG